jgi:hypothetical protein
VCLPSTCFLAISSGARRISTSYATRTYGAGGDTIKALLALDGHVGAVGSLELDVKSSYIRASVYRLFRPVPSIGALLTLGGVVEVLVDKLALRSAHEIAKQNRINGNTYVVGGLAQITESRDRQGEGAVDILGQLLGAAVGLGNVRRERGRHV